MATKATVLKDKDGVSLYPVTDVSLVVGLQEGAIMESLIVSSLPTASASTVGKIYLIESETEGEYDRYLTTYSGGSYSWTQLGSTAIQSPTIADNLTTNDATKALSAKQGKVLNDELTELGQSLLKQFDFSKSGLALQSSGILTSAANYDSTDYIRVREGEKLTITALTGNSGVWATMCGYDENKSFVDVLIPGFNGQTKTEVVTIPSGISFIRATGVSDRDSRHSARTLTAPWINDLSTEVDELSQQVDDISTEVNQGIGEPFPEYKNILIGGGGLVSPANGYSCSRQIPVNEGDVVICGGVLGANYGQVAGYDENGAFSQYLSYGGENARVTIPSGIAYIAVASQTATFSKMRLVRHTAKRNVCSFIVTGSESGLINASGGDYVNETFERTSFIKVVPGDIIIYTAHAGNSSVSAIYGYDSNKSPFARLLAGNFMGYVNTPIEIPNGVSYIRVCYSSNTSWPYYIKPEVYLVKNISEFQELEELPEIVVPMKEKMGEILMENLMPVQDRLDANTVIGANEASGHWYSFRDATISVIDNVVRVVTPGSLAYEGIRHAKPDFMTDGKKLKMSFELKSSVLLNIYVGPSLALQNAPSTNNEWVTIEREFTVTSSYDRIQICIPNTPAATTFELRNFSIIDPAVVTLESRVDLLEDTSSVSAINGKKIAVIGDSISTINGNNNPYWKVIPVDVGNEIQSYVTWWDVWTNDAGTTPTNKTIGGVALTSAMIGTLQTFIPAAEDVGKTIGTPLNYNSSSVKVWSQVLCEKMGATLLANASWSGARICSGQTGTWVLSEAWSDFTIGCCKTRDDDGNDVLPDIIIIYRGTNDFSHSPVSLLDDVPLSSGIPASDYIDSEYEFRAGYYKTIQKLRAAYPKAYIVCCTLNVFKRITYNVFPTRNAYYTLPEMNNAIREIANVMGCGLIEFDKDGITFENCYDGGYITDSATTPTHPNSKGHAVMADKAIADLRYCLQQ